MLLVLARKKRAVGPLAAPIMLRAYNRQWGNFWNVAGAE